MTPLVFLDIETVGLEHDADVWEFGAIRRDPSGELTISHFYIEHEGCSSLPEPFASDHRKRFGTDAPTIGRQEAAVTVARMVEGAHIVGAVPNFDTERLQRMCREARIPWGGHYHLIDVENLVVGYMAAAGMNPMHPPWDSEELSRLVGVEPSAFARHTALGDAHWAMALYDAVMGAE